MGKRRYENLDGVSTAKTFRDLRQWRKERKQKQKDLSWAVPQCGNKQPARLQTNRTAFSLTWIGHATFLIQWKGLNILTDPVWANRMGFEKRLAPPGLAIEELPPIDIVLLSHGHYDHLHWGSLKRLKGNPLFLVPDGLKTTFHRKGFARCMSLSWWESFKIDGVEFMFTPAQHWTRRTLWDMNTSHWGGWLIDEKVYFVGDTGYFRGFEEVGRRKAAEYVLMPIGAYEPEWFMKDQHVTPEEAVIGFLDAQGGVMVPMHYGAFRLADDTAKEALERLRFEWSRLRLHPKRLRVLEHGESIFEE